MIKASQPVVIAWCLFTSLIPASLSAQSDTLWVVKDSVLVSQAPVSVATDALGNTLWLQAPGTVQKKVPGYPQFYHFSTTRLGQATRLDVANPLKTLVWFADFNTVIWLDRNLTAAGGDLNLGRAGLFNIRTVGAAADGNLWLYDEAGFKLRKITPEGKTLLESQDMNLLLDRGIHPTVIRDDGTRVMLIDPEQGIFLFDVYAQWLKQIPVNGLADAVFTEQSAIRYLDPVSRQINLVDPDFPVPVPPRPLPVAVKPGDLCWLTPDGLWHWQQGILRYWGLQK